MNNYPFTEEDNLIILLENNENEIIGARYPADKVVEVLINRGIPVNDDVLDLVEEWLTEEGILYNPDNLGRGIK